MYKNNIAKELNFVLIKPTLFQVSKKSILPQLVKDSVYDFNV